MSIANRVFLFRSLFLDQIHYPFRNFYPRIGIVAGLVFELDVNNGGVSGIRQQAAFVGMNVLQDALPSESIGFEHIEAARVEHLPAGVLDPDGPQRRPNRSCSSRSA